MRGGELIKNIVMLCIYALASSMGLVLMKKGLNSISSIWSILTSPLLLIGITMYVASFLIWLSIVKVQNLSYAFPIATAGTFVMICAFSHFIFHDQIGLVKIFGMTIILIGIVITANA